jgi:hypothetical protein
VPSSAMRSSCRESKGIIIPLMATSYIFIISNWAVTGGDCSHIVPHLFLSSLAQAQHRLLMTPLHPLFSPSQHTHLHGCLSTLHQSFGLFGTKHTVGRPQSLECATLGWCADHQGGWSHLPMLSLMKSTHQASPSLTVATTPIHPCFNWCCVH